MRWATRVSQARIRRLYHLFSTGIYDDELLLEVGWGLHARCKDVLIVFRAVVHGEVPCPKCGRLVHRAKHKDYLKYLKWKESSPLAAPFACPACKAKVTWEDCREGLRNHPRCFTCRSPLERDYRGSRLGCASCGKEWSWQQYLASIGRRRWLPCSRCSGLLRRPEQARQITQPSVGKADIPVASEEIACPRCRGPARHAEGMVRCSQCGYEQKWAVYRKRVKRRVEHLRCASCGHEFTWNMWRRRYQGLPIFTGNPDPVEEFLSKWPSCRNPQQQLIQIDTLLHALHGRGAMGPLFIEGDAGAVMQLLDELAQQR